MSSTRFLTLSTAVALASALAVFDTLVDGALYDTATKTNENLDGKDYLLLKGN